MLQLRELSLRWISSKSKLRSRMHQELLESILWIHAKKWVVYLCCNSFQPTADMFAKFTTDIYRSVACSEQELEPQEIDFWTLIAKVFFGHFCNLISWELRFCVDLIRLPFVIHTIILGYFWAIFGLVWVNILAIKFSCTWQPCVFAYSL